MRRTRIPFFYLFLAAALCILTGCAAVAAGAGAAGGYAAAKDMEDGELIDE